MAGDDMHEGLLEREGERGSHESSQRPSNSTSQGTINSASMRHSVFSGSLQNVNRMSSFHNLDYSHSPSMKKSIKQDEGDYYWANFESRWTLLDQKRLVSMDYLIHRSLEFHNNHHTFRASGEFDYSATMDPPELSAVAMEVQKFSVNDRVASPSQLLHFLQIDRGSLTSYASTSVPDSSEDVHWFNLKDIRSLRPLSNQLRIDPIALSMFYDLRGHSTIAALDKGLFMSFCIATLNGNDAELHKVYCYCTQSYMITFERELISEPDDDDDAAKLASTYRNPLSFDDYDKTTTYTGTKSVDFKRRRSSTHKYEENSDSRISILSMLFTRMRNDLYAQTCKHGTMYMLYEIGMESLSHSDTMIEFVSRTIFYLKQQVHRKLTYTQKLHFHRKVHILLASLNHLDCLVDETYKNLEKIFNKSSSQFSALLVTYKFSHHHMAYITLLIDSYEFASTCLGRQIEDVNSLESVMGHISSIRAEKVSTNLSLIATIFLPVTFLAGVFGMNFEKHGDYTMEILNSPQGPAIFYLMCFLVVVLNLVLFLKSGLVTIRDTEAIIRPKPTNFNKNASSSKLMSCLSAPSSQQNSRDSADTHGMDNSLGRRSMKEALERSSLFSSDSIDELTKLGLTAAADLERLDRDSLDDQSVVEELRRLNIAKNRRTHAATKIN